MGCDDEFAEVRRELLKYLLAHRAAVDTLKGIHEWWLCKYNLSTVEHVLTELAARGWIRAHEISPGMRVYGLNEAHTAEIAAFLKTREDPDRG